MSGDGIRAYAGEFLLHPAGLEMSMNWCSHACTYCFANLMTPNRRADVRGIVGLLSEYGQRKSREARLLRAKVPLLISNHVDPFAGSNINQFEPIWELCRELEIPITWQTRGAHKPHLAIQERIIRETPKAVWYVSIPMLDDEKRKQVEPHAPSIGSRLDLVDQLVEAGHVVTIGINPITIQWMPRFEQLLDLLKTKGVWGVWMQAPYFGKSFKGNLTQKSRDRLGEEFIANCGEHGSKEDTENLLAAMAYAKEIGLQVFSTHMEEPTQFFDPYHKIYPSVMPYWHQLINAVDPLIDDNNEDDYVLLSRAEALSTMSRLPELDWAEPLRHARAKHYRAIVKTLPDGRLPKQTAEGFWRIVWNDELYCKRLGPLKYRRFAYASIKEGDNIIPLLDDDGQKMIVYRRKRWPYLYANTPELA